MFKSLFERKKKSVAVGRTNNNTPSLVGEDREEDGFVLLGETASERSTVLPNRLPIATDSPPSYTVCVTPGSRSTMGQQPSNQTVVKQTGSLDSSPNSLSASSTYTGGSPYQGASPRSATPSTPNRKREFIEVIIRDTSPRPPSASWDCSHMDMTQQKTPVSDVPFRLGEFLALTQSCSSRVDGSIVRISPVNLQQFCYNFELERSVVREFNSS